MAGSRMHQTGSIFTRVSGLLKSGAMKEVDKPLWYDVYSAFPPKPIPSKNFVREIIYKEDVIRARFYKEFGNQEVVNLRSAKQTVCQRFIEIHNNLANERKLPEERLWEATCRTLKLEGIPLRSLEEAEREREALKILDTENEPQRRIVKKTAVDFFGSIAEVKEEELSQT